MVDGISGARRGPWRAARPWLLASAATLVALAAGRPALAAPICTPAGVPSAGATVTCVSDGAAASGITYAGATPDITLVLDGTANGPLTIISGTAPPSPAGVVTLIPGSAATPSLITTTGTVAITTTGNNAGGLFIDGRGVGADVGITVASGTTIATGGATAYGAYAVTTGAGTATVAVSGLITTGADGAHGAYAQVGASGTATALVIMTGGSVATGVDALGVPTGAGASASGLFALNQGTGEARVEITGGSVTTLGGFAPGLFAGTTSGPARITIDGSSGATTITTSGQFSYGANASSSGGAEALVSLAGGPSGVTIATGSDNAYGVFALNTGTGAARVEISGGSITTLGDDAAGAAAITGSTAAATVTQTGGTVTTSGVAAYGLYARSASGPAAIAAGGSITTHGSSAAGAAADGATGATVTLIAAGIATEGQDAYGAYARLGGTGLATVAIDAASTVVTEGIAAHGAYALVNLGTGGALVVNAGSVTTTGLGAAGLYASVLAADGEIRNTGSITTSGSGAPGIFVAANGAATIISSGSIVTSGVSGIGAFAVSLAAASATASVTISGSILTGNAGAAAGAYGAVATLIGASSGLASVTLLGGGSITTTGLGGIAAFADSPSGGDAEVRNAGTITTQGEEGRGAMARVFAGSGNALVVNTGSVATSGAQAHGLVASIGSGATGSATIVNSGSVSASGAAASGIHIEGAPGGYTIAVTGGTVTGGSSFDASLGTGAGISIGGGASGSIDIAAGATVQAASGIAIRDGAGALALTSRGILLGIIDGGSGSDSLTFQGVTRSGGADIRNVESLTLQQGSVFTVNADLVMGDLDPNATGTATRTGAVAIDATSTLAAPGTYAIRAVDATSLVTVTNAGLIAIGSGGVAGNTLTIAGNYVGQGGTVALNTVLAGDGSASDRLVISGGRASGDTALRITNLGGSGAQTVQGIRVVETSNGGTTDAGAFRLNTRVAAGAYEYRLFRGGSSSAEDWYLRSFLIPAEEPGTPTGPAVPLYRQEVSLYAPAAAVARQLGFATLGTLQARREAGDAPDAGTLGKQGEAPGNAAWARVIGERSRGRWDGTVDARVTGNLIGLQAGFDILQTQPYAGGHRDVAGIYVAYTDFNAPSVRGFADGVPNAAVGRLLVSGPSVGAYWTHFGPGGWYLDAVLQASWYDIATRSGDGTSLGTNATGYAASLAAGYPIRLGGGWQLEPSAQLAWQGISVDRARDRISSVAWDEGDALTGRIGARVQYTARTPEALWQPYAQVNLWHAFSGHDRVNLGSDAPIENRFGETALEVGAGITARVTEAVSFFAHADYRWSIAGDSRVTAVQGSIGIRVTW